jgi:hypothetical protein
MPSHKLTSNGLGVDASGSPVIDPTENVKDLMEASIKSITALSEAQALLTDEKIKRMERECIHQDTIANLREEHNKEIRRMESDRVDKIRSVDVANAAATAAQLLSAVTTLATTQQGTAETLRNQVSATAAAVASQTERVINPIIERLALLEKSSYTGAGKGEGIGMSWGVILGIIGAVAGLFGIGSVIVTLIIVLNRSATPVYTPTNTAVTAPK